MCPGWLLEGTLPLPGRNFGFSEALTGHPIGLDPTNVFFLLLAARVRSSCEEGPGQSALQSAYHNPKLDVTELKQNRTTKSFRPKIAKQTN